MVSGMSAPFVALSSALNFPRDVSLVIGTSNYIFKLNKCTAFYLHLSSSLCHWCLSIMATVEISKENWRDTGQGHIYLVCFNYGFPVSFCFLPQSAPSKHHGTPPRYGFMLCLTETKLNTSHLQFSLLIITGSDSSTISLSRAQPQQYSSSAGSWPFYSVWYYWVR